MWQRNVIRSLLVALSLLSSAVVTVGLTGGSTAVILTGEDEPTRPIKG